MLNQGVAVRGGRRGGGGVQWLRYLISQFANNYHRILDERDFTANRYSLILQLIKCSCQNTTTSAFVLCDEV